MNQDHYIAPVLIVLGSFYMLELECGKEAIEVLASDLSGVPNLEREVVLSKWSDNYMLSYFMQCMSIGGNFMQFS